MDRNSDRGLHQTRSPRWRGLVYALSLGVYCSSWTFYGAVGSAAGEPWSHVPIYLGPILVFLLGWPVIRRLMAVGEGHRVTSIADYLGARFGKRQSLAILATAVACAAVLPYIALQFRALAQAWTIVGGEAAPLTDIGMDTALFTAILLAVFTILFGARRLDGHERHQGMMTAIAVESLVKLLAFIFVALLALGYLLGLPDSGSLSASTEALKHFSLSGEFLANTLISGLAVLCLPRQFHVMVVEAQPGTDTRLTRWLFPVYLLLFMLLVIPIGLAGSEVFAVAEGVNPDTYVQLLPLALNSGFGAMAAFVGGISAATGMVIVATVSLAIMLTNEVVAPLLMRFNRNSPAAVLQLGDNLRRTRQIIIVGILLAAWTVTGQLSALPWLAQIGFISFLAAAQLAPALLAGLYWRRAHGIAVMTGILVGLSLWFYCGVLPALLPEHSPLLSYGPLGIDWLRPMGLFGIAGESRLAYATAWSLSLNSLCLVSLSLLLKPSRADIRQTRLFLSHSATIPDDDAEDYELSLIRGSQLQALLLPFVEQDEMQRMWQAFEDRYQQRLLPGDRVPRFVVSQTESVLASMIGASSAHKALEQLESFQQLDYSDLASMVSDASRLNTFNRDLLQTTVESLVQGVSVVDEQLRVVAWNHVYQDMFNYPERFLYIGCPIERVYRYNAERGFLNTNSEQSIEEQIARRLQWLREGSSYRLERTLPDGRLIEIQGKPMPRGGFVTTYIDITRYRDMLAELRDTKEELEQKVVSGSESLSASNALLRQENRLRAEAESQLREANLSKSHYMSAASHDLLQPINAARLFTASLRQQLNTTKDSDATQVVDQIDRSLRRAEQLISELREIARLDSGRYQPQLTDFPAGRLLDALRDEFREDAEGQGQRLTVMPSSLWLHSDEALVHRILQNLLSNALRYAPHAHILVGVRRRPGMAELQVIDTGPGIAERDQVAIFEEFQRLVKSGTGKGDGLGLGLAIVQRCARLLDHPLRLESVVGEGTLFSVTVPLGEARDLPVEDEPRQAQDLAGITLTCLDNEPLVLEGLQRLLEDAGARVITAADRAGLTRAMSEQTPDLILADYHLDAGDTGLDALAAQSGPLPPVVVLSADDSGEVREKVREAGYRFLPKPVNAARLRALILALLRG
ncbi:hybrid sensor histidine kinase/response regulator [Parahaliea maris]|uniref:hybrid sensor histidine kinase/response regulator n=1 Tax=Parahaliea maris TaxID=2716870 RepID=UPI001F2AB5B8|nr:PAS-domain containing protein [Parahaliea maris]